MAYGATKSSRGSADDFFKDNFKTTISGDESTEITSDKNIFMVKNFDWGLISFLLARLGSTSMALNNPWLIGRCLGVHAKG